MSLRSTLPVVASALVLATAAGCSSNGPDRMAAEDSPSTQVRPAQMTRCDELAREVEHRMPTAKTYRVPAAQSDLREAQELCHSGQADEGIAKLNGILGYMDQEP